ncbi:MAG: chromate resistance protein [Betaproteobacteria bacterium]|nr:chromate resistance protein [Betaproteobacteria bacterium]
MEHWNGEREKKPAGAPTRWVTRERPKIDRIACPWLIRRFIDADAEFLYVPAADVLQVAKERSAVPYDVPDVEFSHVGGRCSFDAFLFRYRVAEPALQQLALIVRGADTNHPELAPQAAGLVALSLGLSALYRDDHEMLEHGMVMYDALYAWCRSDKVEVHSWNPALIR